MGSCSSLIRPSINPPSGEDFTYPRFCSVQIKSKISKDEKESVDFYLTDPTSLLCDHISLENSEIFISESTLPGIDPRNDLNRNCQDLTLLLKSGKNRAVLASRKKYPARASLLIKDDEVANISNIHHRRKSSLPKAIYALQLTQDHAPEEAEELARIKSSGGKVRKMIDDSGNKIGPHRVWNGNQNAPGLVVSRSFGDQMAKNIGIISEPTCWMHQVDKEMDLFLVVASDGVWNVMENEDVTAFVESVRFVSSKKVIRDRGDNVNLYNSCAAQLLCEEARFRWLSYVEQEDIPIDDISCIVVEFNMKVSGNNKAITLKQKPNKKKQDFRVDED